MFIPRESYISIGEVHSTREAGVCPIVAVIVKVYDSRSVVNLESMPLIQLVSNKFPIFLILGQPVTSVCNFKSELNDICSGKCAI